MCVCDVMHPSPLRCDRTKGPHRGSYTGVGLLVLGVWAGPCWAKKKKINIYSVCCDSNLSIKTK